jgi:hypothetical protein
VDRDEREKDTDNPGRDNNFFYEFVFHSLSLHESARERIPRSLLWGKQANGEHNHSLWIEDSPQFTAESFNCAA